MNKDTASNEEEELYGLEGDDRLTHSLEAIYERLLDEACDRLGESFDEIADRLTWPVEIEVFRRTKVDEKTVSRLADLAAEDALDRLDEQFGDPSGFSEPTEITDDMKETAETFVRAIVAEYTPWACEPTGETLKWTREEAKHDYGELTV